MRGSCRLVESLTNFCIEICSEYRRSETSEAKREKMMKPQKRAQVFITEIARPRKNFGKNRFLCLPTFFMKLLFCCCFVVDVKRQSVKHTRTLIFTTFLPLQIHRTEFMGELRRRRKTLRRKFASKLRRKM
jgi:hypothetical protein